MIKIILGLIGISLIGFQVQATELPDLAAQYETIVTHNGDKKIHRSGWYIWRQPNRIEIQHKTLPYGEVWKRSKMGEVSFEWLRHDKQFKILYEDADLDALQVTSRWETKATLISPQLLKQLKQVGKGRVLGNKTQKYQGKIGAYQVQVEWIPRLKIPAYVKEEKKESTEEMRLIHVYSIGKTPWKRHNSEDYEDMDYSDIGDNEANPITRAYIIMGGLAQPHSH